MIGPMVAAPAADQVLAVLTLLSRHGEPLPASAIATRLGIPRSTTYRLLEALQEHGYVVHLAEERRFGLGVAAHELGQAYTRQAPLQRLARPIIAALVQQTGQNAHLAVLHGIDVLYLIEERHPGRPSLVTDVGVRLPAHLTASGLALLAALPRRQVRALYPSAAALVRRHGGGVTTLTALRAELADIRQRGHAIEIGTVTPEFSSVAVAATDHTGMPVASFAITHDRDGVAAGELARLVSATDRAARALSERLAGRLRPGAPDATA